MTIPVVVDNVVELDEMFTLALSGQLNAVIGPVASADLTIINDDAALVTVGDVTMGEGNNGNTTFSFPVSLSAPVDSAVSVSGVTENGTATASGLRDFTAANLTAAFAAGALEATVDVLVRGEQEVELDEQFFVNLPNIVAGGRNVSVANARGTATIVNDDAFVVSVESASITVVEGSPLRRVTIGVVLDSLVDAEVVIGVRGTEDTALVGEDYVDLPGGMAEITYPVNSGGGFVRSVSFDLIDDSLVEPDKQFFVDLISLESSGRSGSIIGSRSTVTITNDDALVVSVSRFDSVATEPESRQPIRRASALPTTNRIEALR